MQVNITTRHFSNRRQSKYIKEYSLKKMSRLEKYMIKGRDPSEVNLIISEEKLGYVAEIIVNTGHIQATASVETEDMHASIDKVFDSIVKQLRRQNDKQISSKRRSTKTTELLGNSGESEEIKHKGVEHHVLPAKPMSVEEAMLQLKVADDNFFVFRNSETLEMNVLFKNGNAKKVNLVTPS